MAAPAMAEPRSKRPRVALPACPAHRPLPSGRVRQSFPVAVEEGLCGVTGALLELAYSLQALVRRRRGAGGGRESFEAGGAAERCRPGAWQRPRAARHRLAPGLGGAAAGQSPVGNAHRELPL